MLALINGVLKCSTVKMQQPLLTVINNVFHWSLQVSSGHNCLVIGCNLLYIWGVTVIVKQINHKPFKK